ncbi:NAD(+)/NADH kinase [Thermohalobacter berrensis]|uniref:NAD kinase n=1 Tax=Thermohalobacter berrensis TaxID=99594 RepID=A0A419T1W8_9FIRM|nr:NAD(+)/NADH kinase [Thermohalobacter berrensis]RKD31465.1 NAD(+) kinase [Thermohalobacter berrensis]
MDSVKGENNTVNIIHNNSDISKKTVALLEKKLTDNGFVVSEQYDYSAWLNICVGGDGAFLQAVHKHNFPDIPFVGINTGHLGFFQEVSPHEIDTFIKKLKSKDYKVEEISLVEGIICTRTSCIELIGVNEIVIKGIESKTIHLDISINDSFLQRLSGDGVIISTPIGSTAYNYSAGGSIVYPYIKALQITPLAPINSSVYRSLNSSVIVPRNMTIKINPEYRFENSILIVVDGKQHKYDNIVEINLKLSDMTINMLTLKDKNFWTKLKDKFL